MRSSTALLPAKPGLGIFIGAALLLALSVSSCSTPAAGGGPSPPDPALPSPVILSVTVTPSPSPAPTATETPTATASATPLPTPTATWSHRGPGTLDIPILLYHSISDQGAPTRYAVPAARFEQQMTLLAQMGCETISVSLLREAILQGADLPSRPILITFDDGHLDNYTTAFPIMRRLGLRGALYIVANRLGAEGFLSSAQIEEMLAEGWDVGSHSMTHPDLTKISRTALREELLGSRQQLEQALGVEVRSFAYPFGLFNAQVAAQLSSYGYEMAMGLGKRTSHGPGSLFYLERREVHGTMDLDQFAALLGSCRKP